ncbi:hypothetical protein PABG_04309 [Paracoccidioides brasiliensis Pb03]|uniref:Mannan endo-1,6-alpha-mannosidase n=2 Tax=Paracoccidioides brasiliensis TaxID=121759 RepID=C1GCH1_PARBD|nr:uncharacterized protein PADG_04693 [Paracoccidioides brasiliensis Pb18]EEH22098.2 hypothetical protein PABG_04309 [Paracoccidioides brasiliensis Pb03]EEH48614.1 hypothetical protein PADG_04693 [Paracoccidioides brasiliensis Pb18]ODH44920.1 hypothetical protein ACO22_00543 [Paracoccidioides brasiliensis]ODH52706.1 hypothetical protein GX48_01195 [Paracoccidioides brasiliensis]
MRLFPHSSSRSTSQSCTAILLSTLLGAQVAQAVIPLTLDDPESIKSAAKIVAKKLVSYYTGWRPGDVPGNLPDPYYWWEAGAMFGALIDYWYFTGDDQYNEIVMQAMLHQTGPDFDYQPHNQSRTSGNDDQAFWGMAAMTAAETKFQDPAEDKPQWLALAQGVFNTQAPRWANHTCNGGLKWSINTFGSGWTYKNTISNGCFFNLASRLALYTGNTTYANWAEASWNWMTGVGLISPNYQFFDGTDDTTNCTRVNHVQWSYNSGVFLAGAASMYKYTNGDKKWEERVRGILKGIEIFFQNDVMTEVACERNGKCNVDQRSFKAYLSRWMAMTVKVAPFSRPLIMPKLRASAEAAAKQCSGPDNSCGLRWTKQSEYDGETGVGEQMSALEIIQANLVDNVPGPANEQTGTSKGDPNAGLKDGRNDLPKLSEITMGDKVGAGFMTSIILLGVLGGAWWMMA